MSKFHKISLQNVSDHKLLLQVLMYVSFYNFVVYYKYFTVYLLIIFNMYKNGGDCGKSVGGHEVPTARCVRLALSTPMCSLCISQIASIIRLASILLNIM